MLLRDSLTAFSGGECCPALFGRTDINKYKTFLRAARNITILPQGGARSRAGTEYIASAYDSTHAVRLMPVIISTTQAYILEFGNFYIRFYTQDGQVQMTGAPAWMTLTPYVVGNYVTENSVQYYCLVNNTSGVFATDLASGYWVAMNAYQIPSPYASVDIFNIKYTQSADVLYLAHTMYYPRTLTFNSPTSWDLENYIFTNGPFLPANTDTTSTITPSALTGTVTLTASKDIFTVGQVQSLYQLISSITAQTSNPTLSTSVLDFMATGTTWQAVTTGSWSGTIFIQTSPDNITWTTVSTVVSNGTVSGTTGFTLGFLRAILDSSLTFTGTASVVLTGDGSVAAATNLTVLNATTPNAACGSTATITITGVWSATISLEYSTDGGNTWTALGTTYTTNQAATTQATGQTACLIRAQATAYTSGTPHVTVDGTANNAPTLTVAVSTANVSLAIQCGENWSLITNGTWTGVINVQASIDGGNTWQLVNSFESDSNTVENYNTSGSTGFSQCLLRVSSSSTTPFTGSAIINLTSSSFDWIGIVLITAYTNATKVTGTVQNISNTNSTGLANLSSTYQWSEGAWSSDNGFPGAVTFYQDRIVWGGPQAANLWLSQTSDYTNFFVNQPILDTDSINIVLAARTLNAVENLIPMPQAMLALTSDTEFGVAPGPSGDLSPTSVTQSLFSHRGSAFIDPVVVGNEILYIQQMGVTVRNFIFQLAVNGFQGDNISLQSQHLFIGYSLIQMAYQQEPDSLVWVVRNDGVLLSCTYMREQEMQAWTRHDTLGNFESVACIPNPTLGINEVWVVVNRTIQGQSVRMIEVLKPRDQGTAPNAQWFVDCGLQYNGSPTNVITGLSYLNGQNVSILADGSVLASPNNPAYTLVTVANGQITLPNSYQGSVVTVGLPYVTDLITLDAEVPQQDGTTQGQRLKGCRMKIRMWNSRGGYISATDPLTTTGLLDLNKDKFSELTAQDMPSGGPDNVYSFDSALPLLTGITDEILPSGYDYGSHIAVRQVDPLPLCILSLIPAVSIGGQ